LRSIKAKLIVLYSLVMITVLSVLSIVLFISLRNIVYKPIDSNLLKRAKLIDSMIKNNSFRFSFSDINGNKYSFSFSDNRLWVYSSRYSKYFFQIRSLEGETLEKSLSLGKMSLPFNKNFKKFENINFKGKTLRLLNYVDPYDKMIIQIAYDADREAKILSNFTLLLFVSIVLIMITSAIGGFVVSNKALKPINDISLKISRISNENLNESISVDGVPYELEVLVSSFNDMLKRLDKAFKQQKRFISDISHELKTPLSVILMQADMALKKERSGDEYKKAIESIREKTDMMSKLIEKMLLLASLESKYNKMSFSDVSLEDLIKEAIALFAHKADKRGIEINMDIKDRCMVKADKLTLLEVFSNIFDNAIKYNKENGRVDVSIKKIDRFAVVEVKDTGIGIPKDRLGKITEEFYRVDESRSKQTSGFGLGLSIVKRIVELHRGKLEIDSKEGKYTSVKIFLPVS